ncbi:MAG: hypothetical protein ACYC6Y_21170, partial [Thermoguttaceae bacterium]
DRVLFPEYLTCQDKSAQVAAHVVEWLTDERARRRRVAQLEQLRAEVAHGGASARAADYILAVLQHSPIPLPSPHFLPNPACSAESARRTA